MKNRPSKKSTNLYGLALLALLSTTFLLGAGYTPTGDTMTRNVNAGGYAITNLGSVSGAVTNQFDAAGAATNAVAAAAPNYAPASGSTNYAPISGSTNYAPIASPALTGTPTAPTPSSSDSSTKLATTASVHAVAANYLPLSGSTAITGDMGSDNGSWGISRDDGILTLAGQIIDNSGDIWANPSARLIYDQYNEQAISTVSDTWNTDSQTTIIADSDFGYAAINGYLFVRQGIQVQSFGGSTAIQLNHDGSIELNGNGLNTVGGLARLTASDGTADGSIAFLGTTDDGDASVAIGNGAYSDSGGGAIGNSAYSDGGGAIGNSASASNGGGAIGNGAYSDSGGGGAIGNGANSFNGGGAIGNGANSNFGGAIGNSAYSDSGGGGAIGYGANSSSGGGAIGNGANSSSGGGAVGAYANATTGFAGGASTAETGGGANFCGGTYAATGIAINGNEIANVNGRITSFYAIQRITYTGGATAAFSITADSNHNILAFANGSTSSTTTAVTLPTGGFDGQTLDISYKTASTAITYAGASQIGGITAAVLGAKQRFIWDATLSEWR